ncbi:MAG: 4Fe-4S dicluster domain-containing protein [Thermoguttaceae bacterium]|nr:4Fe-4S dicluster domain-containing protein [Thermoguttaceae bacterium]
MRRAFGRDASAVARLADAEPWRGALRIIREYADRLDAAFPAAPSRCGFALRDVFRSGFDPTRFFVGSEGALGIITEAKLATSPVSAAKGSVVLLFDSPERAATAARTILTYEPTLCDLLDQRLISLVCAWDERFAPMFPNVGAQCALVVELDADNDVELNARLEDLRQKTRNDCQSIGCWTAVDAEERQLFRDLLRKSSCAGLRASATRNYFPPLEDLRLPVEEIPGFLRDVQQIFRRDGGAFSVGGFIGVGQLTIQSILPSTPDSEIRAAAFAEEVENLAISRGGEIGCAKGNGRIKTAALQMRFPEIFPAFVKIKDHFDPKNRFNPDCVVSPEMRREVEERALFNRETSRAADPDDDLLAPETEILLRESALHSRSIAHRPPFDLERLRRATREARVSRRRAERPQLDFQISWNPAFIYETTLRCVACGHCRIQTSETRMCPAFRLEPEEIASPRAKANLARGVFDGVAPLDSLTREDALKIATYCVRCHCCASECPAQVDAPRIAFRLKSAHMSARGASGLAWFAPRADIALSICAPLTPLLNAAIKSKPTRKFLEFATGLSSRRQIPRLARRPYLSGTPRKRPAANIPLAEGRKVALFIDSHANFCDVELVEAALKILEFNGFSAFVHPASQAAGSVAFAVGSYETAKRFALRNVSALRGAIRDGCEIVTLEPTTAVCIKKEYPYFLGDTLSRSVFAKTSDFCGFLQNATRRGWIRADELRPIPKTIGYHAPCRTIALTGAALPTPTPAQRLLALIPELKTRRLEFGCCGFADFSALTKKRFEESMRIGAELFAAARDPEIELCASECSFCCMQLAQGAEKPARHVVKLLAESWGLL